MAAFLLGAWLACCVALDVVAVQNYRFAGRFLAAPAPQVAAVTRSAGLDSTQLVLRHFAAEQGRVYLQTWDYLQLPIALLTALFVYYAAERRWIPPLLVGLMFLLVAFQAYFVTPELNFRGRDVDFPPARLAVGMQARVWALTQVFAAAEATKIIIGLALASFLFSYRTRRRVRSTDRNPEVKVGAEARTAGLGN